MYTVVKYLLIALSHLPLGVLYALSDFAYVILHYVVRYRRTVVRKNLDIAFGDKDEAYRRKVEKRFYRHLCDYVFETIKAFSIDLKDLNKRYKIRNPELVNYYLDNGRSVFLYCGHFGNWEWSLVYPSVLSKCQFQTFYQSQSGKGIDRIMTEMRTRVGNLAIESHKAYRHIVECMRNNIQTFTLIIADQSPHRKAKKHWTNFFNHDTAFLMGPEAMAVKTNQVLIYPSIVSYKRGYYEIEMKLIDDKASQNSGAGIIDKFAVLLEDDIRRTPELWLWSHNRWKHKHEDYPD
ncbi:MAG: lysophospholipid acyltransferase family protein [Bacteroidales bacterium]|nr:lysophospholipid acyltransferase family protein [Bacteroidales bacterium]